jgi:chromosome segregation ATPase
MANVWDKLFRNNPVPANDSRALAIRYEPGEDTPPANSGSAITSLGALTSGDQGRNGEAKSLKVARTFDAIGRRNESLRTHLDAIEFSFRNIEAIRSQFYDALGPIDQTLIEIERTKVAHLETERKFEALTEGHERLRADHAALTLDRNALAVRHEEASERVKDLEKANAAVEAAASEARAALAERRAKLERTERELEDNKRRLHTVSEQLPALRAEFSTKEKRLQEVEQQRAALQDQNALMSQENRTLRTRSEEFVANVSKLNRQLSDLQSRRDDLARRVEELEATIAQETAAHAKLKAAHLDAAEAHRLTTSNLREELSAMTSRSEAAERLLAEAREKLRERDAEIRGFEQRALESSLALKSKDVALADLDKDLTSARALHAEVDTVRAALDQRSTELAKGLEAKDAALQRAEQKIVTVESRLAEQSKATDAEREELAARLAKLKEQLEAEQAARAFADGALQAARQERGSRRHDAEGAGAMAPKDPSAPVNEVARDKIARLRG